MDRIIRPPLYHEAARRIRTWIRSQTLPLGARLPSERTLAQTLGIARSSLNKGMIYLEGAGEIRRESDKLFLARPLPLEEPPPPIHILRVSKDPTAAAVAQRFGAQAITVPWDDCMVRRERLQRLIESGAHGLIVDLHEEGEPIDDLLLQCDDRGISYVVHEVQLGDHNLVLGDPTETFRTALLHLAELGHSEFAYIGYEGPASHQAKRNNAWAEACALLGLPASAERRILLQSRYAEELRAPLTALIKDQPEVTAVILAGLRMAHQILPVARQMKIAIPDRLSVVAYGGYGPAAAPSETVSSVGADPAHTARVAAELLFAQMAQLRRTGVRPTPQTIKVHPLLASRKTVIRLHAGVSTPCPRRFPRPHSRNAEELADEKRQAARANWNRRHTLAAHAAADDFETVPLDAFANRSTQRRHGWLGEEPLAHFPPGLKPIHGVPFRILDERRNNGHAVITLRSAKVRSAKSEPAPYSLVIPLSGTARALYILHAAGWVPSHDPFAWYRMDFVDGQSEELPLIPYAYGPSHSADIESWRAKSLIQDWWPGRHQFSNDRALPVVVTPLNDPLSYERYLYTLEWPVSRPDTPLRALAIRSNPDTLATLAVLALTILR